MPRSSSVSVPRRPLVHERRPSLCLEDYLSPIVPREYDSWPCDSFFLLPETVLSMDASDFRDDLRSLDPVLSDSLPDWSTQSQKPDLYKPRRTKEFRQDRKKASLMENHSGLRFHPVGKGTVLIGSGGDGRILPGPAPTANTTPATTETTVKPSTTAQNGISPHQNPPQKDCCWSSSGVAACLEFEECLSDKWLPQSSKNQPSLKSVPEEITDADLDELDRASGLCFKDREERVRHLREKQQQERNQKLEELKEQAAAAQKFREQQELLRRQRLEEMRHKDTERRNQVEERRKILEMAEKERREATLRRNLDKEQRVELKRRQERSNAVFAFGSSTPRMLDPKETSSSSNVWGSRRATSTTNVNVADTSDAVGRPSEAVESDLSRKRATSAHSLNRKPDGEDLMSRSFITSSAARRRTDLFPALPSMRDPGVAKSSRHRSPGRTSSMSRLDQMSRAKSSRPSVLTPLHEKPSRGHQRMKPARTMSKSMSHLGPQRQRPPPIGAATDGSGVPVSQGALDKRSSRSSLALAPPRLTRSEILRQNKLKGISSDALIGKRVGPKSSGVSGATTPGSPSRPTSALSQGSSGPQVILRTRNAPRKQRPLSIAGSVLSSADKPRESASVSSLHGRESRPIERKSSTGSTSSLKQTRAKSVENKNAKTPSKAPPTPKRTPAQVKADSAARKLSDRTKPKTRLTPKTTPMASPSVDSKTLPGQDKKTTKPAPQSATKDAEPIVTSISNDTQDVITATETSPAETGEVTVTTSVSEATVTASSEEVTQYTDTTVTESVQVTEKTEELILQQEEQTIVTESTVVSEDIVVDSNTENTVEQSVETVTTEAAVTDDLVKTDDVQKEDRATDQKSASKPVTGYATEEEYKQALAEKRRQAREEKERKLEMERQKQLEQEEKERREEEEYMRLIEEQRIAEEERLQKAIEEASKQREVELKQKEEEEKQRIEAERIEKIKQAEAEEKMKKEEEARQARKSRVAQIMARTRGKGTPKTDEKSPDENRTMNESLSESFINDLSSSMTDSMIVQAIESHENKGENQHPQDSSLQEGSLSSQTSSGIDMSSQQSSVSITSDQTSMVSQDSSVFEAPTVVKDNHINGGDTNEQGSSVQTLDLLEPINGSVHNGSIQNGKSGSNSSQFSSLDPLSPAFIPSKTENGTNLDQIIDLSQMRITNEDAINSNHPAPIIAFEDNINTKQHQDTGNVPDLLL